LDEYLIGVLAAILGGSISSLGVICQKKVVNDIPPKAKEQRFFRSLVKRPLWLLGLILGTFAPAVFVVMANLYVGPALTPGLMSAGLIVLAIGSVKINKEHLGRSDYAGIFLMIVAIFFLGFSQLSLGMANYDFNVQWILINSILFQVILFVLYAFFAIIQRGSKNYRAVLLIFAAGFMFATQNFWMAPLSKTIFGVFLGTATPGEWTFFILSAVILSLSAIIAIVTQQTAYKYGQASTLNTLQQFPTQMVPPFLYLFVFMATPPFFYSLPLLVVGTSLVLVSSFLLAKRKVEISKIK